LNVSVLGGYVECGFGVTKKCSGVLAGLPFFACGGWCINGLVVLLGFFLFVLWLKVGKCWVCGEFFCCCSVLFCLWLGLVILVAFFPCKKEDVGWFLPNFVLLLFWCCVLKFFVSLLFCGDIRWSVFCLCFLFVLWCVCFFVLMALCRGGPGFGKFVGLCVMLVVGKFFGVLGFLFFCLW